MSKNGNENRGGPEDVPNAGSSTDQQVTGSAETGTFTTDRAPTGNTPAHGSNNAGVNATRANRVDPDGEPETGR
jgi:hypothetical protein